MGVIGDTFKEPMFVRSILLVIVIALAILFIQAQPPSPRGLTGSTYTLSKPAMNLKSGIDYQAELETDYGSIVIDLYEDIAPQNVNNFIYLARKGFYNKNCWHRIITNVLIQSGDPTCSGKGGPGYYIEDEINDRTPKFAPGIVGMASFGKDKNASQFFIIASKAPTHSLGELDGKYTVIGKVIKGMDIVDKIAAVSSKNGKPVKRILLNRVSILEKKK